MKKIKKSLMFALALLPVAAVAGFFVARFQLESIDAVTAELLMQQVGSMDMVLAVTAVQTMGYALVCGFFGHILANKLGLWKPLGIEKAPLLRTVLYSLAGGVLFSLDKWTFGKWIPEVGASYEAAITANSWLASVLYGGIIEELMLRLFVMSLIALILWKVFFRRRETVPAGVVVGANILAALLFAAGHLPATVMLFGELTPLILLRCFLLNGSFGLLFGHLYRKYGIQYAMISHGLFHIVSKLIWIIF